MIWLTPDPSADIVDAIRDGSIFRHVFARPVIDLVVFRHGNDRTEQFQARTPVRSVHRLYHGRRFRRNDILDFYGVVWRQILRHFQVILRYQLKIFQTGSSTWHLKLYIWQLTDDRSVNCQTSQLFFHDIFYFSLTLSIFSFCICAATWILCSSRYRLISLSVWLPSIKICCNSRFCISSCLMTTWSCVCGDDIGSMSHRISLEPDFGR